MQTAVEHGISVQVQPGTGAGLQIAFDAHARPGLLALFSGILTLADLDITWASIRLRVDGTVRDTFEVAVPSEGLDVAAVREALDLALERFSRDPDALKLALAVHRAAWGAAPAGETSVEFEQDSAITLGIRVRTPDRPGVLHDVAAVLARHGLRTRSVSVLTMSGQARDVFRVVGPGGTVPSNSAYLARLRGDLLSALL